MTRYLAAGVTAVALFAGWGATLQSSAQEVECSGGFPIYDNTAMSETENEQRIACVKERRRVIAERISERRKKRSDITDRIEQLRNRKQEIQNRIERDKERAQPLNAVISLLSYIRGEVSWAWKTGACESGHNPEAHSPSGKFHGEYQFALGWKDSLDWFIRYGSDDPHTEPAIVQTAAAVELKREGGSQHWPVCG